MFVGVYSLCVSIYIHIYNGVLFSLKKDGSTDTNYNMDELWGNDTKWNKPVTKKQIL